MDHIIRWLYINTPLYYPLRAYYRYKMRKFEDRVAELDMQIESLTLQNEFAEARTKQLQKKIQSMEY